MSFSGGAETRYKKYPCKVRARQYHMKPFVRTSFLSTRPSCLPSPGRPSFDTDDRKPNLWLGRTGSSVKRKRPLFSKNALKIFPIHDYKSSRTYLILRIYIQSSCGRLLSEVFQRKANYFILTTTSEKTIQLTTALLHHFCDFLKTFESDGLR